jgi:hypothetical protein
MEADDAALRAYYERGMERERLSDGMLRERIHLKSPAALDLIDEIDRTVALDVARAIERVSELVGFGPHLIATGIR